MPESKPKQQFTDPTVGPLFTARFLVVLVLIALGIGWILYYYLGVRPDPTTADEPGGPAFVGDLGDWNYLIGFGLVFLGLIGSAHPKTPLGRGRGVVVGMLGCFVLGLLWICTFYVFADSIQDGTSDILVFNDLGQKNLMVGIGFMAVGFTFATRWE